MKNFVGIDLGTTNSAICSYNGEDTRIWKSPEQNDVTPSAIYIDRRGNKYIGKRAYDSAPYSPGNSAMLFKRLMGTSTPVRFTALNLTKTPEECSAEILKVLYGYLPEEIRNDPDTGTVITVPAAFNQMQKDATMQAATMAGIGNVALMQEPVAAVMSVMRSRRDDGMFLIYDFGGGTLDIAIAESLDGRVSLLSHGGLAMCGGRDFDRRLVDAVVCPWLLKNFHLPEDFTADPEWRSLMRLVAWATEKAKIELSAREESVISLSEAETRVRDLDGDEIFLDILLKRETYDALIAEQIMDSVEAARETLKSAGLSPGDLERIVFVGGPTNYKPLRDRVSSELEIPGSMDVNPMTAVAEGASLFAESIDWTSRSRSRKDTRGHIVSGSPLGIAFNFTARTPSSRAKIVLRTDRAPAEGSEFQIDSLDTGWTSGRLPLEQNSSLELTLSRMGDNSYRIFVFDPSGGPVSLERDTITVTRTAATVDAIPASHSIGIEVLEKLGGKPVMDFLVKKGDPLPRKGKKTFKAGESLEAGSASSLNFKLWEGEIAEPLTDNRPIGVLKISGSDFENGVIHAGADLICDYEILDSGNIRLEISVPCIGATFNSDRNFYSRQEGQLDYSSAASEVAEEGEETMSRVEDMDKTVDSPKLEQARQKLESALALDPDGSDTEQAQEAMEKVYEAKKLLAEVRREHLREIRQSELEEAKAFFNEVIRKYARPSEEKAFDNLMKTAQKAIDQNESSFENLMTEQRSKNFEILWRQDGFVIDMFTRMSAKPHQYADRERFEELVQRGKQLQRDGDIDRLRSVVSQLAAMQRGGGDVESMFDAANIIRG